MILTLETSSTLVRAVAGAPAGELPATVELTELCPVSARQRVRSRVSLAGKLRLEPDDLHGRHCVRLRMEVGSARLTKPGADLDLPLEEYRQAEPDPLHEGAAEQLQHLEAHHQDAVVLLSRLCGRESLSGATRVLPIGLDRYGLVLRVERLRGHIDVRLGFRAPVASGVEAVAEMRHLFAEAGRRRPCRPPTGRAEVCREHGQDHGRGAGREVGEEIGPEA